MNKFLEELRKLPRFTSPKGMLFPANDGELVEVGSVIALFRSFEEDQKAITELAVKRLKEINVEYMKYLNNENECDSACSTMDDIAENTLVEIERLSQ